MLKLYNAYVISIIACMGGMLFGFDISSMSAFLNDDPYQDVCTHWHVPNYTWEKILT